MATVAAFSLCGAKSHFHVPPSSSTVFPRHHAVQFLRFQRHSGTGVATCYTPNWVHVKTPSRITRICSATEEEGKVATSVAEQGGEEASPAPVSVSVSPSDVLTMFFQAEGTMNETAILTVTKALEGMEGISDLKVKVIEGIASVELTKQTTIQATGVASGLVETIQGSGFKLQTLNLSFQDEEDIS